MHGISNAGAVMTKVFDLHKVCTRLVEDLRKTIQPPPEIMLSIDVRLHAEFKGSPHLLISAIRNRVLEIHAIANTELIVIELLFHSMTHQTMTIHCLVVFGNKNTAPTDLKSQGHSQALQFADRTHLHTFDIAWPSSTAFKPRFKGKKLLVAEDNPIHAQVLESFLEEWGVEIHFAADGVQAVRMTVEQNFDAILMDLHMPLLTGLEAIKKIRVFDTTLPIVAIMVSVSEDDMDIALRSGANECLQKPVSARQLFKVLSMIL